MLSLKILSEYLFQFSLTEKNCYYFLGKINMYQKNVHIQMWFLMHVKLIECTVQNKFYALYFKC